MSSAVRPVPSLLVSVSTPRSRRQDTTWAWPQLITSSTCCQYSCDEHLAQEARRQPSCQQTPYHPGVAQPGSNLQCRHPLGTVISDIRYQMFAPPYHLTWSMSPSPSTSLPASTRTRSVAASCAAVRPYTR